MAFVTDEKFADYSIKAVWAPSRAKWVAWVERRDTAQIYRGESPDYVQILREGCHNIRSDVEDWAGFDPRPSQEPLARASASVGRYALSYHPTNYNRAILLDTKTGAVWQLQNTSFTWGGKNYEYPEFSRVSVNDLYMSTDEWIAADAQIDQSQDSEEKKRARRDLISKTQQDENERERSLDER